MSTSKLYEAYYAVYDEDLRKQLQSSLDENFDIISELYDDEVDEIIEELIFDLLDEGYDLEDIESVLEEVLAEAKVTIGRGGEAGEGKVTTGSGSRMAATDRLAARKVRKRKETIEKVKGAVKKTSSDIKSAAKETKFKAVDAPAAKYATKRGIGGPAPGLSARSKDPAKRRALRGSVISDIASRAKAKLGRGVDKARASGERAAGAAKEKVGSAISATKTSAQKAAGAASGAAQSAKQSVKSGVKKVLGKGFRAAASVAGKAANRLGEEVDILDENYDFLDEETAYIIDEASDYFMEEGLNEDGVFHVIEQLGVESFNLFLVSISENYVLSEARRSGRIEPVTKTGKDIGSLKGGAKASAIRAKQKEKAARDKSDDRPSGMTAALKSQSVVAKKVTADRGQRAVEKAKTTQSGKKPLKDRIAKGILGAVKAYQSGVERHKAATQTARKAVGVAAKGASEFGKGVASGVKTTGKAVQATHKLLKNSYDLLEEKKNDSYLETDMNKRRKNNEKAVDDIKKTKAHSDMAKAARKHFEETTFEEKMKDKDPCWKGYEMIGKKKKGGKEVPNCVPKESYSLSEKTLEPAEKKEKERLVKGMKKSASDFKSQYGEKGKSVMYATATKMAKIREEAESTEPNKKKDKLNKLINQLRDKK